MPGRHQPPEPGWACPLSARANGEWEAYRCTAHRRVHRYASHLLAQPAQPAQGQVPGARGAPSHVAFRRCHTLMQGLGGAVALAGSSRVRGKR
jgi:hypothetical protein